MDFGEAIKQMRVGRAFSRTGWNGKGMWIALQVPDINSKMTLPYIYMKTAQGDQVPWLASMTDMLAQDWDVFVRQVPGAAVPAPNGGTFAATGQVVHMQRQEDGSLRMSPDPSQAFTMPLGGGTQPGLHVFAGAPDARQQASMTHKVSRFRPTYRALAPEEKALHDLIKHQADDLDRTIALVPKGREASLAVTNLELAVMWAVKALTA